MYNNILLQDIFLYVKQGGNASDTNLPHLRHGSSLVIIAVLDICAHSQCGQSNMLWNMVSRTPCAVMTQTTKNKKPT